MLTQVNFGILHTCRNSQNFSDFFLAQKLWVTFFNNYTRGEFYFKNHEKIMEKFVKLYLHSNNSVQNSFQFNDIFCRISISFLFCRSFWLRKLKQCFSLKITKKYLHWIFAPKIAKIAPLAYVYCWFYVERNNY